MITGNGKEIVNHVALQAIDCKFRLVGNLRIVFVKILREVYYGLLDKFQVACTANNNPNGNGIICFHFFLIQLRGDIKLANATRKVGGTSGKRVHLQLQTRCLDGTLNLNIP